VSRALESVDRSAESHLTMRHDQAGQEIEFRDTRRVSEG
jgi:hypothetical protein